MARHGDRAAVMGIEAGNLLVWTEDGVLFCLAPVHAGPTPPVAAEQAAADEGLQGDPAVEVEAFVTVWVPGDGWP